MKDYRYDTPQDYGSNTRYNQMQNYPNNIPIGVEIHKDFWGRPVYNTEESLQGMRNQYSKDHWLPYNLRWSQATNKYDMQNMIEQGRQWQEEQAYKERLADLLQRVFNEGYIE